MKTLITLFIFATCLCSHAQQTTKIIVPNGPGSMSDTAVRAIIPVLEKELSNSIAILNIPGANGLIGQLRVAEATDTEILIGNSTIALNQLTNKHKVNVFEELEPIYGLVEGATIVYVSSESKIYSLSDLKKFQIETGRLIAGSTNKTGEIALNQLSKIVDAPIEVVQYKLQTDMAMNCVSNLIQLFFGPDGNAVYKSFVESGKIRPIAVIAPKRSKSFPNLKTIREQGYDIVPTFNWTAFFVKKSTSPHIKTIVTNAIKNSMNSKEMLEWSDQPSNFNLFKIDAVELKVLQLKELEYFKRTQSSVH